MEVNKFEFAEWLKDLFDIGFRKVEMEGSNIKSERMCQSMG